MSALALDRDLRGYFAPALEEALDGSEVEVAPSTRAYLLELLARYAHASFAETVAEPLVMRLARAVDAPPGPGRLGALRAIGDDAMVLCGFFDAHLERRGLERRYVASLGGRAYAAAARAGHRREPLADVYGELAARFLAVAGVLDEVRERTTLRTPQDIVRLYERWKRAPTRRLLERLRAEGVFPGTGGGGLLH